MAFLIAVAADTATTSGIAVTLGAIVTAVCTAIAKYYGAKDRAEQVEKAAEVEEVKVRRGEFEAGFEMMEKANAALMELWQGEQERRLQAEEATRKADEATRTVQLQADRQIRQLERENDRLKRENDRLRGAHD